MKTNHGAPHIIQMFKIYKDDIENKEQAENKEGKFLKRTGKKRRLI